MIGKIIMTVIVLVFALPGLIIEPGPLSEMAALAALSSIWGFDIDPTDDSK